MGRRAMLVLAVLAAVGCRAPGPPPDGGGRCTRIQAVRQVRGMALCEDVWTCGRPPEGGSDRIGLRRLAPCDAATGPIVLYLPGMHMNAELPLADPRHDLRLYLAQAGIRTWGIDYRTHAVGPEDDPAAVARWNADTFTADAAWAAGFVRGAEAGPLFLAGFSFGGSLAYRVAARRDVPVAGLVILDAIADPARDGGGGPEVIDVGSNRLPFADRQRLLAAVIADAGGPSPLAGHPSAGAALADLLFTSARFGGRGGLSAARDGAADIAVVARLLRGHDRWWPRAALAGRPPAAPRTPLPVLGFASANLGPEWVERVRADVTAFGGPDAQVRVLPGFGHLDVLVGRGAPHLVFEPVRRWLLAVAPAS